MFVDPVQTASGSPSRSSTTNLLCMMLPRVRGEHSAAMPLAAIACSLGSCTSSMPS
jgi:hypothetical protein